MNVGIIGLGKMGQAVAIRLLLAGYTPLGFDRAITTLSAAANQGITVLQSVGDVARQASVIFLFVPAGDAVDSVLKEIIENAPSGTIIIDGGNSFFKDSMRRAQQLAAVNILFLDCGTSGGIHGQEDGFCLMVGGDKKAYQDAEPIFKAIASPDGYAYLGPSGAGHYVKMIHNGIEYGLLQAYAEGFNLLHSQQQFPTLDLQSIAQLWNHGSVIRSWLLELTAQAFSDHGQTLETISGSIEEGGTGRWTLQEAKEEKVSMPVLEQALQMRAWSRQTGGDFSTALIALIRNQFGGHPFKTK